MAVTTEAELADTDIKYPALRKYSIGVLAGGMAGLAIGGVLGRLVMFLLRLTSPASALGKITDAKSVIGQWSLRTFGLLETGIALGVLVGMLYVALRLWLPSRGRPVMTAIFGAFAGGALFIRPGGVDFYVVRPLWLTVPVFMLLPAIFGYLLSYATERMLDQGFWRAAPAWLLWVPIVVVTPMAGQISGPVVGAIVLVLGVAAMLLRNRFRTGVELWRAPATRWIGSRLLLVLGVVNIAVIVHAVMFIAAHPGGAK